MTYQGEQPAQTYNIRTATDLDNLASGGVITLSVNTQLIFENLSAITTSNRFDVTAGVLAVDSNGGPRDITYIGGGTFYTFSGSSQLDQNEVNINGATTGTLFSSTTTGQIEIDNSNFIAWSSLGSIVNSQVVGLRNSQFIIYTTGLTLDVQNFISSTIGGVLFAVPSTPLLTLTSKVGTANFQFASVGTVGAPADVFKVEPDMPDTARVLIEGATTSGSTFDTAGSTGSFTAVADAAVASTTIDAVVDDGGIARFEAIGGVTVYNGQEITTSGFVAAPSYNATGIVQEATTGGVITFELVVGYTPIAFVQDESGSYAGDSVTVTSTSHGLSDGQTLTIDTDDSTEYDGAATIYNALTNTFQINRTFGATQTGSWDTSGIDEADPRVLVQNSPAVTKSTYLGAFYANNINTVTTPIVNNTFRDVTFGTGGAGLIQAAATERFKLIDDVLGIIEYIGNEPFSGEIGFNFSVVSSGGNQEFRFKWVVDRAPRDTTFVDLTDNIEALADVGSTAVSVSKTLPVSLSEGDQIKPQVTRNAGSSDITVRYVGINVFQ